jgi:hypothetical protein
MAVLVRRWRKQNQEKYKRTSEPVVAARGPKWSKWLRTCFGQVPSLPLCFFPMETARHLNLKRLAVAFLRRQGCLILGFEVQCPIARYRLDVAGYQDRAPADQDGSLRSCPPQTIVIECKQSREDFLRDCSEMPRLIEYREALQRILASVQEHRVKRYEPHLRRAGTSLFPELDEWDFRSSQLRGYRRVVQRLRRLDEQIHGQTKFFLMSHYRLADRLYLAAPEGVIRPCDVPRGWGLLECAASAVVAADSDDAGACDLRVRVEAPQLVSRPRHRLRLLRNIAVAASRREFPS